MRIKISQLKLKKDFTQGALSLLSLPLTRSRLPPPPPPLSEKKKKKKMN